MGIFLSKRHAHKYTRTRSNEFISEWNGMHRVHGLSGICPEAIDTDDDRTHTHKHTLFDTALCLCGPNGIIYHFKFYYRFLIGQSAHAFQTI